MTFFTVRTNLSTSPFTLAHFRVTFRCLNPRSSANDANSLLLKGGGGVVGSYYIRNSKFREHLVLLWYHCRCWGRCHYFHHWVTGVIISNQKEVLLVQNLRKVYTDFLPRRCWEWWHLKGFSLAFRSSNQTCTARLYLAFYQLVNVWKHVFGMTMRVPRRMRLPDTVTVSSSFTLSKRQNSSMSTPGRLTM